MNQFKQVHVVEEEVFWWSHGSPTRLLDRQTDRQTDMTEEITYACGKNDIVLAA